MAGRLRIIAGALGGRRIEVPPGRAIRPTPERVREAWFSALGARLAEARVLDLYSGSGALGIEALSRGARHAHFVESDGRAVAVLERNLADLGLAGRADVSRSRALAFLDAAPGSFDLALADPPYDGEEGRRLLDRFRRRPFAAELWIEHRASAPPGDDPDWTRRYGDTAVSAYLRREAGGGEAPAGPGGAPPEPDESRSPT